MIDFNRLKDKRILVMGLGLHGGGMSVARWFCRQGANVTVTDLKSKKELAPSLKRLKKYSIKYVLGQHRHSDFKKADIVIQNPGVPPDSKYLQIARRAGALIENEASVFFRLCPAPIMAVTGTKGKSSLVSLLFHIFKARFKDTIMAGNIRDVLMLDVLGKVKKTTKVILELSSWHLEGLAAIKKSPHFSFITNIMPDHLNRYGTMANYIKAKELIFKFQAKKDFAVINADNQYTRKIYPRVKSKTYLFSIKKKVKNGAFLKGGKVFLAKEGKAKLLFSLTNIPLIASYQREQILAASIAARLYGISKEDIYRSLKNYRGLHDRLEFIGEFKGIKYYNDTAATMPQACLSALRGLGDIKKKNIILLAGGADKNLVFKSMAKAIPNYCKGVLLFKGKASQKLNKLIKGTRYKKIVNCMREAVSQAKKISKKGDIILLSPGAASFGLFKHEFDRGEQFKKYVKLFK